MTPKRLLHAILLPVLLLFAVQVSFAQQKTITGRVTDSRDGSPVSGATVTAKGSKVATSTAADGSYKITVPSATSTLVITGVGFATTQIAAVDNAVVSFVSTAASLNEIVVTGYGTSRKKDVTGAVASVSAKDFNQGIVTNAIEQIQGKVSGLVITTPGGDPNQSPLIKLRGQTSLLGSQAPLIVVDGIPLDNADQFNNIPPGDIATYDVLKDASAAAIYGARGANGVILVTTKRGREGQTRVEYSGYVTVSHQAKYFEMLSADEWRNALKTLNIPAGSLDKGVNTDWQKEITRTAFSHNHNLAVSGGAKGFSYRAAVSYLNQQGIVLNTGKDQIGLRFNATQKALNDKLELQVGIVSTTTNRSLLNYGNITKIFNTPPTYPVRNADGSYFYFSDFEQYNAVAHLNQELNKGKEYLSLLSGTANYEIIKGLKVGVTGSLNHLGNQTRFFQPAFPVEGNVNNASNNTYNNDSKHGDFHINYLKDFGKHSLGLTGVYEYNKFESNFQGISSQNFLVPENQDNNFQGAIDAARTRANTYRDEFTLISFLGRVNYNYNQKYYLTASIRRDGSSKFGANNRWGLFPSFDVAWRISQEAFLKDATWLTELKLRAGYGVTGNSDAIGPYSTQLLYGPIGRYYDAASGVYPQAYAPVQNQNPDLRWEERHGRNIGLDFGLFNNRITGDINYFSDKTVNLLYNYTVPVPPFFINTILANVGTLTNKGLEFQVNAQVVKQKNFSWTLSGQLTFINTKVDALSGTYQGFNVRTDQIGGSSAVGRGLSAYPITFLKPGYAPSVFYLPHYMGLDANGHQLFETANGPKTQDQDPNPTKKYIDPSPKMLYGVNNNFTYGNWSLNFFLRGLVGQKIFNNTRLDFDNVNRLPGNNVTRSALTNGIKDAAAVSDLWLEKASYLRLDNATLAYNFGQLKGMQNLRVYVSGNNLFVITPYKGIDPEIQTSNTGSSQAYLDVSYYGSAFYPRARSFTFGVNVTF